MSEGQFAKLGAGIADVMEKGSFEWADIRIVGGEPSMMGELWWIEAGKRFRATLDARGVRYRVNLGSHLMSKQAMRVAKLRVFDSVSTSYDAVGGRFQSERSEALWESNVRALLEAGTEVVVSVTITKAAVSVGAAVILDRLASLGVRNIALCFCVPRGRAEADGIVPAFVETSRFQIEGAKWLFDRMGAGVPLTLYPTSQFLESMRTNSDVYSVACTKAGGGIDINPDGESTGCPIEAGGDCFASVGNVFSDGVLGVVNGDRFRRSRARATIPHRACLGCEEMALCQSGCSILRERWNPETDGDCPGFREYLRFLRRAVMV